MPWTEKNRPSCFHEIKGQEIAIDKVKRFLKEFELRKSKKSLILHGPPGTGKTTLAHVAAKETNAEIFELNASDLRNKKKLEEVLRPALEQQSLTKKRKIILIDEVDGVSATDRGGLSEILSLIIKTKYPIILTANDIWNKKFTLLRKKSEVVPVKDVDYRTIKDILICILRKEKLFVDGNLLTSISIKAKGDIRAAINDLQTIAHSKETFLPEQLDERNKEETIFEALRKVFKNQPKKEISQVYDSVNLDLDKIMLWVEANIPLEYKGEELAIAYDRLSKADVFKGRIYKQQYWRFLVYQNILLSYGISASKKGIKTGFTKYKKPTRILKIWMNNQRQEKKKSISIKYAKLVHVGTKRAMHEFPVIKQIIKQTPTITKELKLTDDELTYLKG